MSEQEDANRDANAKLDALDVLIDPPGPPVDMGMTASEFYARPGRVIYFDSYKPWPTVGSLVHVTHNRHRYYRALNGEFDAELWRLPKVMGNLEKEGK